MQGLNRATLVGHLGADPELKHTQAGHAVLRLRVATTESYLDRQGERRERTDWHTVVVWGKRADALDKLLAKGAGVCIEGRIQTRSWEGKSGGKQYATEINASNVVLLGGGGGSQERRGGTQARQPARDDGGGFGDDDIPF